MFEATWILLTAAVLAVMLYVVHLLARENRMSIQQWRARVTELERERDNMIEQVAIARGVDSSSAPAGNFRAYSVDPDTGNIHFDDGEVRGPEGTVLIERGSNEATIEWPS